MKKIIFLAAVVAASLAAGAQTFVSNLSDRFDVIPGDFCIDGQPRLVFGDIGTETNFTIKNNHLQQEATYTVVPQSANIVHVWERLTENGTWSIDADESGLKVIRPTCFSYYAASNNTPLVEGGSFHFTQSLFNATEDYEYLMPVIDGTYTFIEDGQYRFTGSKVTALKVMNGNTVVGTINPPSGYFFSSGFAFENRLYVSLFRMGNMLYLVCNVTNENREDKSAWYSINSQSQSITLVETMPMSVRPSMVEHGQEITVEFGEGMQASELEVVNTLGQTVKRVYVQPGQREVHIGTADLGHGMNLISSPKQGAVKIIVK